MFRLGTTNPSVQRPVVRSNIRYQTENINYNKDKETSVLDQLKSKSSNKESDISILVQLMNIFIDKLNNLEKSPERSALIKGMVQAISRIDSSDETNNENEDKGHEDDEGIQGEGENQLESMQAVTVALIHENTRKKEVVKVRNSRQEGREVDGDRSKNKDNGQSIHHIDEDGIVEDRVWEESMDLTDENIRHLGQDGGEEEMVEHQFHQDNKRIGNMIENPRERDKRIIDRLRERVKGNNINYEYQNNTMEQ